MCYALSLRRQSQSRARDPGSVCDRLPPLGCSNNLQSDSTRDTRSLSTAPDHPRTGSAVGIEWSLGRRGGSEGVLNIRPAGPSTAAAALPWGDVGETATMAPHMSTSTQFSRRVFHVPDNAPRVGERSLDAVRYDGRFSAPSHSRVAVRVSHRRGNRRESGGAAVCRSEDRP